MSVVPEGRGTIVAGVDFGTLSARVSIVDSVRGVLGAAVAEYPLHRRADDPDHATQSHNDQMAALTRAMREALAKAAVPGSEIAALAVDTTGSSVVMVDAGMRPLGEYYLWCDHRSKREAEEITEAAHRAGLPAIDWCGGFYSPEWGFSKVLHWLRHNPEQRAAFASAFENCDMVAATLAGITEPARVKRSVCAMGHKWMWNRALGGLPPEAFLAGVDPLLAGVRDKLQGEYATSDQIAGHLSAAWAEKLGLKAGIPIPVGALDAHWDAIGAGAGAGDVVNVLGTSSCVIAYSTAGKLIPGVCGVVPGSVHPGFTGIEAGLSAVGDLFSAIAVRAGVPIAELSRGLETYRPGQTGLMRLCWDNGDRTVLGNARLGGVTLGWNLQSTARDELFAAIEGTAFHTRVILDRMEEYGAKMTRVINGGGIPQHNAVLNQVYADVLNRPVLVPASPVTGLGSAIFAFLAAGTFPDLATAQKAICPGHKLYQPRPEARETCDALYAVFRQLYFALGKPGEGVGDALPSLIHLARG